MNTTKLHIIAKALRKELTRVGAVALINQAIQALQNQINQPQQPNHQQQLSSHLTSLYQKLEESPVNDFSPAWRDAMDELGVSDEFGARLEARLRGIFERNQITPQAALEELKKLHEDISGTETHLAGLVDGLERRLSRYLSIFLRCFVFNFSLLGDIIFRVQPHVANRFPVSRSSTPSLWVSLLCRLVDRIAFRQNRSLHAAVTLCWGHKLNPAVAMLFVVPMDKFINPFSRRI